MSTLDDIRSNLIEAERQGGFVNALASAELRDQRGELGEVLCELHDAGCIDLTSDRNLSAIDALEHNDFWIAIHPLNKAIPNLNCSHLDVLKFVNSLVTKAGADGAAGMPNLSLITWSQHNPDKAQNIVGGIKALDDLCLAHGVFAVLGLGDEGLAFDLIRHTESAVIGVGLLALGRMERVSASGIKQGVDKAFSVIESETDADVRASAMEAAFRLWEKLGPLEPYRQREFIEVIGSRRDPTELSILSAMLFFHNKGLPKESIDRVLGLLATTPSNSSATLRNLDLAIKTDDDRWEFEQVVPVFAECIPRLDEKPDRRAYHSFPEWVWSNPQHISYLFANWLNGGKFALCSYLTELLSGDATGVGVWIQKAHIPPNANDQIFMARKCIGFLWHREVTAASILLSILKNGKATARTVAEEFLFNPLLLSYGGDLRQFLETQLTNRSKRISECAKRLLAKHDAHLAGIETTKGMVELLPTIEQRRAVAMKDRDRNRDIQKQAQERSIFASLATRQTLLYGRKSFSIIHGTDGAKHPNISALSEISHSVELPRLMVIDPVGFSEMLQVFRIEQRKTE